MRVAIELAGPGGQLVLFHVCQPPYTYGPDAAAPGAVFVEMRTLAEQDLARWKAEAQQLGARHVSAVVVTGTPWNEIVEHAKHNAAIDLIAMGTHGRTGIKHVLLGSVAEKVVRHAPCPVLVVRARE